MIAEDGEDVDSIAHIQKELHWFWTAVHDISEDVKVVLIGESDFL